MILSVWKKVAYDIVETRDSTGSGVGVAKRSIFSVFHIIGSNLVASITVQSIPGNLDPSGALADDIWWIWYRWICCMA